MQWAKIMIVSILLLTGIQATGGKWQKLKPLKMYSGSAYHLKKNVAYMEIRWYASKKSKKRVKTIALYRKPLDSYPQHIITNFKSLKPRYSKNADIFNPPGNAFFIDSNGKMFQMDMKKDIISLLGKIDRPAEVALVLYLNRAEGSHYCKKISKGYRVKIVRKLKDCTSMVRQGNVDRSGKYTNPFRYNLQRKGCKKRKHTQFVHNQKINYQSYSKSALDERGGLYVLGEVKKNKYDDDYATFYILEKYSNGGKKLWSKKLKGDATDIVVKKGSVYVLEDKKIKVAYSPSGKKISPQKINTEKIDEDIVAVKYFPEGLPNKKEAIDFYLSDYTKDKKGNIYIVGSEVFYPSGGPDDIPARECGNVEQVLGALVAKLDNRGRTVWVKVVD